MAERRMFSKKIIDTDAFLDMPLSAQALYFHLSMRADDEGFIGNPKRIRSMVGASEDDMKLLILKRFILVFESGVVVVKHWRIHNCIQTDRFKPTTYIEERDTLALDGKKAYIEKTETECIQDVYNPEAQFRLGKGSVDESRIGEDNSADGAAPTPKRFVKPVLEEIEVYCKERNNNVDAQRFFDFYESKGWKVGNQPMKDWRACVRTWEKREGGGKTRENPTSSKYKREE